MPGKSFYALSAEERGKAWSRAPHRYQYLRAREWLGDQRALRPVYNATGDQTALRAAERAARYIMTQSRHRRWRLPPRRTQFCRPLSRRHSCHGTSGSRSLRGDGRPPLARSTADRAGAFIAARFKDPDRRISDDANAGGNDRRLPQGGEANRRAGRGDALRQHLLPLSRKGELSRSCRAWCALFGGVHDSQISPAHCPASFSSIESFPRNRPTSRLSVVRMHRRRVRFMRRASPFRRSTSGSTGGTSGKGHFPTPMSNIRSWISQPRSRARIGFALSRSSIKQTSPVPSPACWPRQARTEIRWLGKPEPCRKPL